MITLYHGPQSCSVAVKAVLEIIGAEYSMETLNLMEGEHLKDKYLNINPHGKVPALVVDGEVITEGGAILLYLAEKYPEAELIPSAGSERRAQSLRWLFNVYTTINPAYARVFLSDRYSSDAASVKENAENDVYKAFEIINQQLGKTKYIADDSPTLADYYLLVAIHWEFALSKSLTSKYENVKAYKERMMSIEKVGKVFGEEYGG